MEHVVFFPAADGAPAFRRVASLDEAVRLVEHLRNDSGVSAVSVHALTEVPLAFRAYYRVEVPTADVPVQAGPESAPALALVAPVAEEPVADPADEVVPEAAQEPVPAEDDAVLVGGGARDAGPASLGFFA